MANGNGGENGIARVTNWMLGINGTLIVAGVVALVSLGSRVSGMEKSQEATRDTVKNAENRMDRIELKLDRLIERSGNGGNK